MGKTLVSSSMIDRIAKDTGRRLCEVPVGFKWFVDGLLDGSLGFGGEESAGASFLRRDGTVAGGGEQSQEAVGFVAQVLDRLAAGLQLELRAWRPPAPELPGGQRAEAPLGQQVQYAVHGVSLGHGVETDFQFRQRLADPQPPPGRMGLACFLAETAEPARTRVAVPVAADPYVLFPCSFEPDEPVGVIFATATTLACAGIASVVTGDVSRIAGRIAVPSDQRVRLSGYVPIGEYRSLVRQAAVIVAFYKAPAPVIEQSGSPGESD